MFKHVLSYYINRDKKIWGENANQFDPDNFAPSKIAKRPKSAFLSFGWADRVCIGQHFALMEASLAMAMILINFDLEMLKDYQFELADNITLRPKDFRMKITPK
ncbi:MAG: cytochrome P450 [Aureispira sp.]|nr:cytochrome P450 [Aureispira sp.]